MKHIISTLFLLSVWVTGWSQLSVNAGPDQVICSPQQVTLTATAPAVPSTSAYTVASIPWAPEVVGGTNVPLFDDAVSGALPVGFTFCFLGAAYTQFYIGSNGWISFSAGQPTTFTSGPVPSTAPSVPKNCIMGPWQDWNPLGNPVYIKYQTIGTAPFRKLVVTFDNIPMFSCSGVSGRFQIVCNETTNTVENHIFNKQFCAWAGGTATQAIHNATGTVAYAVPGRNSTVWTAVNESWRYTPSGPPGNIVWTANGVPVGTGSTITVTPQQTTTYTASLNQCGASVTPDNVVVTIAPTLQLGNASVSPASCTSPTGGVTLNLPPGVPGPFSFQWNDPASSTTQNISGIAGGQYTVQVTNLSNNCQYTQTYTVPAESTLELSVVADQPDCFNGSDGSATVNATSDFPGYTYQWNDPQGQTGATASGLQAGTYTVVVQDADGCEETTNVLISQPPAVSVSVPLLTNVTCAGLNNGTAVAVANGGTPGYSFNWSNGSQLNSAVGLAPGSYGVTVTDANGCEQSASITITTPEPIEVTFQLVDVGCAGGSDGQITAIASGGSGALSYTWPDLGITGTTAANLPSGSYTVVITDGNNCETSAVAEIGSAAALSLTSQVVSPACFGQSGGQASVSVNGGTPNYEYQWNDPAQQTGATAGGLAAGLYTVVVTDANGCLGQLQVEVNEPSLLSAELATSSDALCFGQASGSANLAISGGTPGYVITYNGQVASNPAFNLAAGIYSVQITDSNGCSAQTQVQIDQPTAVTANATSNNPDCFGGTDGSASVVASGGIGGYSYTWAGSASTSSTAGNLSAGTYSVTVTDGNGCTASDTVTLSQPSAVVAAVSSQPATCGLEDGSVSASGSGGTGPYTFAWPALGAQGPSVDDVGAGSYQVIVTDANGCVGQSSVAVAQVNMPNSSVSANISEGYAPLDVTFTNGGTNATTYVWDFGDGTVITTNNNQPVQHTFLSDQQVEEFLVTVTAINAGGCEDEFTFPILIYGVSLLNPTNIFTPNADSKNDTFRFVALSIEEFECTIFNRWGQEVYRWNDVDRGWPGNDMNGADCSEGTYWYIVRAKGFDGTEYNLEGNVTLLRDK
ncbi:MAG: gliding motility-associated C-terminal domain-containing protein [Flavobacteriales bacterium]|jgi:gliding motility-associated-like protein